MKISSLRIALSIVALLFLVIGAALVYIPTTKTTVVTINQEKELCNNAIGSLLEPQQSLNIVCPVQSGGWVSAHATSGLSLNYTLYFSSTTSGGAHVLYHRSTDSFLTNFPIYSNGTISLKVQNLQTNSTTLSGAYGSAVQVSTLTLFSQRVFHYRDPGIAVVGISSLALLLLIWNPRKIVTRRLDQVSEPTL